MNTIFMNSKNNKTSKPHILVLNLTDKLDLRRSDEYVALSNFSIYYAWKNIKKPYNNNKFKIQLQHGIMNLNYLMGLFLYHIFKIISDIF